MKFESVMQGLEKWKPGVKKSVLIFFAGFIWVAVGCLLNYYAFTWIRHEAERVMIPVIAGGLILAFSIHRFGFRHIVEKNLVRLMPVENKRCLFSFYPWRSYFIILIMMSGGSLLRHSAIPKLFLAPFYTGIGTALILSGLIYWKVLGKTIKRT